MTFTTTTTVLFVMMMMATSAAAEHTYLYAETGTCTTIEVVNKSVVVEYCSTAATDHNYNNETATAMEATTRSMIIRHDDGYCDTVEVCDTSGSCVRIVACHTVETSAAFIMSLSVVFLFAGIVFLVITTKLEKAATTTILLFEAHLVK